MLYGVLRTSDMIMDTQVPRRYCASQSIMSLLNMEPDEIDDRQVAQSFNGSEYCRVGDGVIGAYIFFLVLAGRFSDEDPSIDHDHALFKETIFAAHSAAGWASGKCLSTLLRPVTGSVVLLQLSHSRCPWYRGSDLYNHPIDNLFG